MDKRIIYTGDDGMVAVIVPAPECGLTIEQIAAKDVPQGAVFEVVDVIDIPSDRTFRGAWRHDTSPAPQKVAVDLMKAKDITHARRRAKREEEFKPHDEAIMKQLPGKSAQDAEAARAAIRARYDTIQANVDKCGSVGELKAIIEAEGL